MISVFRAKPEPFLIRSDWELDAPISEVRAIIDEPLSIKEWWSAVFMDVQNISEGHEGGDSYKVKCFTKGFLPHSFQFIASINSLTSDELIIVTHGDFDGIGIIGLSGTKNSTHVSVEWRVMVNQPYIRPFLRLLKPIFVWNHLWAMRQGRTGLIKYLLQRQQANPSQIIQRPTFPHNLKSLQSPLKWRV